MKYFLLIITIVIVLCLFLIKVPAVEKDTWAVESIDTMKTSRDLAREKLHDASFDSVIDKQVSDIAKTGATHVAIGTPYDKEFLPYMKRWVDAARKYNLNVWFRGNWSGWEEWFEYEKIDRPTHIAKTEQFVLDNKYLFENGDIFSSCPECENGGEEVKFHDQQEVLEYRAFLITEYEETKKAFQTINRDVAANYYSMNGDVAKAVMDRDTTAALDGLVVVDHYVESPDELAADIRSLAQNSGGNVFLGEFGAPIPDIHGEVSEEEQKKWLEKTLTNLATIPELKGVNYWTHSDSSTALWRKDGSPKPAVITVKKYFTAMHK